MSRTGNRVLLHAIHNTSLNPGYSDKAACRVSTVAVTCKQVGLHESRLRTGAYIPCEQRGTATIDAPLVPGFMSLLARTPFPCICCQRYSRPFSFVREVRVAVMSTSCRFRNTLHCRSRITAELASITSTTERLNIESKIAMGEWEEEMNSSNQQALIVRRASVGRCGARRVRPKTLPKRVRGSLP